MDTIKQFPLISIALIFLACIKFEYHTETSSFNVPGLAGGMLVIGILGIVLLFKIFNAVESYCMRRRWLRVKPYYRYDILIPVTILAVALHMRYVGPEIATKGEQQNLQWIFEWSDKDLSGHFVLSVIGIVLLLRILTLIRSLNSPPIDEKPVTC
ncbi:hypothetical protein Pla110_21050 [Polystyrenella longa]|uniref:Uncharacterized protein n=1 Tax=Polystyrenella longa TaxID=2528007 RepID=A0A518CMB9_9PLAN|nr:hypothetical protein [Polystyrenella longa]QDU80376.1 hypothetical protein Pla110_21050 [Polystyrenella longa]